ncbi:MAG: 50S ribosomal protein L24 [Clostridiales Family XIII bacterium]|jgi:large subunit ribosomal protein L24|nr:50S ribosomal protein L24 [Clostridiales Family XIII bacterium]
MRIKKDDTVIVITGKDKGKHGKVLKVDRKSGRIIVEGVNVQTKHQKQTRQERSDIKHQEGPIDASNVLYYDSKTKTGSRIGYKVVGDEKVRIAKKTGAEID